MAEERLALIIEKLVPGGDGLARADGYTIFIPGVLPGEHVVARLSKRKKGWARARLLEVLEGSPDRREPFCPLFGDCGGCSWQHIRYGGQVDAKAAFCREALVRQGGIALSSIPEIQVTSSRPRGYRCRIRPVVLPGRRVGFRANGSDRIVPVASCPVATVGVNRFLENPPAGMTPDSEPVVFGASDRYAVQGLNETAEARVSERLFRFPPGSFFQSNLDPLDEMIEFALEGAESSGHRCAMDLYGGVGLFGAFLSDRFDTILGVDRDSGASEAWNRHVGDRGEFHGMALEDWVRGRSRPNPDFAIVDPPRTGLSESVRSLIAGMKIPRFTYVSCDPVTQARDLKDLLAAGYRLDAYGVFDLYPQTPHVETVARLHYGVTS